MRTSFLHYTIIEKLGEGGMGVVYLAKDNRLGRKVALKFLPSHVAVKPEDRKRFEQEARAAAALNHPNIAQVFAIEEDRELFIVMEYVEGVLLSEVIQDNRLSLEEKIDVAEQIARGLRAAHAKGIFHRDIKASNIMIDRDGRVKIMDFGLARTKGATHITKTGSTIGTTAYMSPEQLEGGDVDERSDIWSFGVVLYELFAGELPFQGVYEPAVIYAITQEDPLPQTALPRVFPEAIEQVIDGCLEKDPGLRYQNFDEVLAGIKGGSPVVKSSSLSSKPWFEKITALPSATLLLIISLPVVLLIFLAISIFPPEDGVSSTTVPDKKYLAVLPVENIGGSPDLQAICDGLAETFSFKLTELEQYESSYWVTPASEMRKENIASASQANTRFGVNLAILSSIQTMGDSTRLMMELVDADKLRRLGTERIVVPSNNLALLERNGIRAMLKMMHIPLEPGITQILSRGEPSQPEAYEYYLRGRAALQDYTSLESLERAVGIFNESLAIDGNFALGHAGKGEAYWKMYETTGDIGYVEKAETALNRALELNNALAPVQTLLGNLKTGRGEYDHAIMHFDNALEIDSKYSPAYRGLAKTYDAQGNFEQAVLTYQRSIDLKPEYWEGYKDLGIHYLRKGNFELAINQFQEVIRITPRNSTAYSNLGVAYYYNGDNAKARQMFEKSLALEKNPLTANNLAGIYYWEGKYEEAAKMYEIALSNFSNRYEIWGNLASAYEWSGQKEKAEEAYLMAIEKAALVLEVNPSDPLVLADLGAYHSDVMDTVAALRYISQALKVDSENIRIRQRAVSIYENLGMREEALRWIDAAMISDIELQPEFKDLVADQRYKDLRSHLNPEKE